MVLNYYINIFLYLLIARMLNLSREEEYYFIIIFSRNI